MNRHEHILVVLEEECLEMAQAISKMLRFGTDDHHVITGQAAESILQDEVCDFMAMVEMAVGEGILSADTIPLGMFRDPFLADWPDDALRDLQQRITAKVEAKQAKVEHFIEYARSKGVLID